MLRSTADGIKAWIISLFVSAINRTSRLEDRLAAVRWLKESRDVITSELTTFEKVKKLNSLTNSRAVTIAVAKNVGDAVSNYRTSKLPWSMKIALPATLAALPFVGAHGAGIVAFGTGIGVPVLLLIFLGAAGITSIIESVVQSPESRSHIFEIIDIILREKEQMNLSAKMKAAMKEQPFAPGHFDMPDDEMAFRQRLYEMDPYNFELYIMSLFQRTGMQSWVTKKSNDFGIDGFAFGNTTGWIAVQCKRNSMDNKVGGPVVLHFSGALRHQGDLVVEGYIVTTSTFTKDAIEAASKVSIHLMDMDDIVAWKNSMPQILLTREDYTS